MNAAFFDVDGNEQRFFTSKLSKSLRLKFYKEPISEVDPKEIKDIKIASGFIYSKFPKEQLEKLPKLKFISTQSTGFDHIDLKYCKFKGIKVSNVPEYGSNTVAEHAFALILALAKRLPESISRVKSGIFNPEGLTGFDLKNKTIGVVGVGKIGKNVIKIAKGFGMKVIAFDLYPNKELEKFLNFSYTTFNDVLLKSDIISFHCPISAENKHILNKSALEKTKKGVLIVNTSRGGLIDNYALHAYLENGHLGGVALDVLEGENNLKEERELLSKGKTKGVDFKLLAENHVLINHPRVIVTPHNAFNSKESLQRILNTTVENISSFLIGSPINIV